MWFTWPQGARCTSCSWFQHKEPSWKIVCSKGSKINVDGIKAALCFKNQERYSSRCIILNLYTNPQSMVLDKQFNIIKLILSEECVDTEEIRNTNHLQPHSSTPDIYFNPVQRTFNWTGMHCISIFCRKFSYTYDFAYAVKMKRYSFTCHEGI